MAKRKNEVSSTQMVRELLEVNPNLTAKEAVAVMAKKGRKIHPQTFYTVKSVWTKKHQPQATTTAIPQMKKKRKIKKHHRFSQPPISDPAVETEILRREVRKLKDIMMRILLD